MPWYQDQKLRGILSWHKVLCWEVREYKSLTAKSRQLQERVREGFLEEAAPVENRVSMTDAFAKGTRQEGMKHMFGSLEL